MQKFNIEDKDKPFESYDEFMRYLFSCVDVRIKEQIKVMQQDYASDRGGYRNVMYPDLETAEIKNQKRYDEFFHEKAKSEEESDFDEEDSDFQDEFDDSIPSDLLDLLGSFSNDEDDEEEADSEASIDMDISEMITYIMERGRLSREQGMILPFLNITEKLNYTNFAVFCFTASILSSLQTDYATIFQVINQNSGLPVPTIESAAKIYYGSDCDYPVEYDFLHMALYGFLGIWSFIYDCGGFLLRCKACGIFDSWNFSFHVHIMVCEGRKTFTTTG